MFDSASGVGFFVALSFLAPLMTIGLVVLGVVAVSRGDFDPTGRRGFAFYLYSVCFFALFAVVFSGAGMVSSVASRIGDDGTSGYNSESSSRSSDSDSGSTSFDSDGNLIRRGSSSSSFQSSHDPERNHKTVRSAVQSGAILVIALALFAFHWGQAEKLTREPGYLGSPAARVRSAYLYLVCFVAVLVVMVAGAIAVFSLFRVVFPEIAAAGERAKDAERDLGAREFLVAGPLVAVAVVLASTHWRWAKFMRPLPPGPETASYERPVAP